jgi:sulfur carrier protein
MMIERKCQTRRMETAETKTIQVVLNGEPRSLPPGLRLDGLLRFLEMDPSRVAIELNGTIVRKFDWVSTEVLDGAQVEVVWFVGGG